VFLKELANAAGRRIFERLADQFSERIGQLRGPFCAILNHRIYLREFLHHITRGEGFAVPAFLKDGKHARRGACFLLSGLAGAQQLGAIDVDAEQTRGIFHRPPDQPPPSLKTRFCHLTLGPLQDTTDQDRVQSAQNLFPVCLRPCLRVSMPKGPILRVRPIHVQRHDEGAARHIAPRRD
jgi:hypothetical protein